MFYWDIRIVAAIAPCSAAGFASNALQMTKMRADPMHLMHERTVLLP